MTLTRPFVVRAVPDAPSRWQVLAGGDLTGGSVVFGEASIPPRTAGPSLHVHTREDEAAYVLEQESYFVRLTGPPDEGIVAAIGERYGVTVVGPPSSTTGE